MLDADDRELERRLREDFLWSEQDIAKVFPERAEAGPLPTARYWESGYTEAQHQSTEPEPGQRHSDKMIKGEKP